MPARRVCVRADRYSPFALQHIARFIARAAANASHASNHPRFCGRPLRGPRIVVPENPPGRSGLRAGPGRAGPPRLYRQARLSDGRQPACGRRPQPGLRRSVDPGRFHARQIRSRRPGGGVEPGIFGAGKLAAFTCHGGWTPISAKMLQGRRTTGSVGIEADLENADAKRMDEPAVADGNHHIQPQATRSGRECAGHAGFSQSTGGRRCVRETLQSTLSGRAGSGCWIRRQDAG